ncbi:MAG: hypothetical protein PHD11_02350 [Bacteroidales bacterium]|nr:hypothetical protein [Bacteroidales bacterium]MDD4669909.1 hypothetical protein [Bacteroidales bacterium]
MGRNYCQMGFVALDEQESRYIIGGIDKSAQEALYIIGYTLGVLCRNIVDIKSKLFRRVANLFD